ncbi:MAG: competence/damage-inducible protein A [Magnetococcales bacterium]|nr:competence/damage-inducible protein A [Magnetococcales bacterium]NGZ27004.1 competence/damage-inducible protein A [Magnetococcales bacterium]
MANDTALPLLTQVGLVIIGDEILSGRRQDSHMSHTITTLGGLGVEVVKIRVVGDHRQRLTDCLQESRRDGIPTFCFGGIGATPDDHTRQAAGLAWGVPLVPHEGAVALLVERFGRENLYPHRIHLTEFPVGSGLIPNPYNNIAGFYLDHHWFMPGFPEMARPMLEWICRTQYRLPGQGMHVRSLVLPHAKEGMVAGILEELEAAFSGIKTFSLPKLGENPSLELGVKGGDEAEVDAAFAGLQEKITIVS